MTCIHTDKIIVPLHKKMSHTVLILHNSLRNDLSDKLTQRFNEQTSTRRALESKKNHCLKQIRKKRQHIVFDPPELVHDHNFALRCVKLDGCIIRYFSSILSEPLVEAALHNNPKCCIFIRKTFWSIHRRLALLALHKGHPNLCRDALSWILSQFRDDREVILAVASHKSCFYPLLRQCSRWLTRDCEIALTACVSYCCVVQHVGELLRDREFVMEVVGKTEGRVDSRWNEDWEVVQLAVRLCPNNGKYVGL